MTKIAERVKKLVVHHLDVDEKDINEKSSFTNDLGADSLDQVELVMALEDEFECEIPDEDAEKIQTFGTAVQYIEEKLAGNSDAGK